MDNTTSNDKNVLSGDSGSERTASYPSKEKVYSKHMIRNKSAATNYIKDGRSAFFSCLGMGLLVLAINILVLYFFDGNLWSLYWTNMGFVIIRPIFNHFNGQVFEVINVATGESWEDSHWLRGILIGLAVLGVVTWGLFSLADVIFPPYTFMKNFILIAAAAFVSGYFVLQQFRMAFLGLKMWRAGKRTLKDLELPFLGDEIRKLTDKFATNTIRIIAGAVIICLLAVIIQYAQVLILTPKIRSSLDTLEVYRSAEGALPFSDEVIKNAKGEFKDFSTEYKTFYEGDIEHNGIKGHYEQRVSYEYNFKEKKWKAELGGAGYDITELTDANVSGVFTADGCTDNVYNTKDMSFALDIKSLTTTEANGTFTVRNATEQTYSSKWSGTVTHKNGCFYVTGKLSVPRKQFFDAGYTAFNFIYHISEDAVTVTDDYSGVLHRQ